MGADTAPKCTRCSYRKPHHKGLCRRCREERAKGLETFQEVEARMNAALGIAKKPPTTATPPRPSRFNVKFSH